MDWGGRHCGGPQGAGGAELEGEQDCVAGRLVSLQPHPSTDCSCDDILLVTVGKLRQGVVSRLT